MPFKKTKYRLSLKIGANIIARNVFGFLAVVTCLGFGPERAFAKDEDLVPSPHHNIILFVADGLRAHAVRQDLAPAFFEIKRDGVDFPNSHSVYPSLTTPNAAAIATGYRPGDTGDFGNSLYIGPAFDSLNQISLVNLEDNQILKLLNQRYGGNFLGEPSLTRLARAVGYQTAVIGKLGPVAIQDLEKGTDAIVIDDATGDPKRGGFDLPSDVVSAMRAANLSTQAPDRGSNGLDGTHSPNRLQQSWFCDVTTKILLPRFHSDGRPFFLIYWSRDPDGTQHLQGDSPDSLIPGIDGDTSLAAIHQASDTLAALRQALKDLGLDKTTDIVVVSDHGFSTISRQSRTSKTIQFDYNGIPKGELPPGFVALDLARALNLDVFEPLGRKIDLAGGDYPHGGHAILAKNFTAPQVVIAANGGSDLVYIPDTISHERSKDLIRTMVTALTHQDYTAALFVRDDLGPVPGTLPTRFLGMAGKTKMPRPALFISFKSFSTGCADREFCAAEIADIPLKQGQGAHGSLGREDTHNFLAAIGPDFKTHFQDQLPSGNADIAPTLAAIMGIDPDLDHPLKGRVLTEALNFTIPRGVTAKIASPQSHLTRSDPAENGFVTVLRWQSLAGKAYLDAAGATGRAIGVDP